MNRNRIIVIVAVFVVGVVAFFPTIHVRSNEEVLYTYDLPETLPDRGTCGTSWNVMNDQTRLIVQIQSNYDIQVSLKGVPNATVYDPVVFYNETKKLHNITFIRSDVTYEAILRNPTGSSAVLTGSIKTYHLYDVHELLPWWMP